MKRERFSGLSLGWKQEGERRKENPRLLWWEMVNRDDNYPDECEGSRVNSVRQTGRLTTALYASNKHGKD